MRALILALGLLAIFASRSPAAAQNYPRQTIKFIVPFPPGGAADLLSRVIAQKLSQSLGQSVIIENRAGVAGSVGAAVLSHAAGDGYTIGLGSLSTLALNPFVSKSPLYDPRKDFTPIARLTELPVLMAVSTDMPESFDGVIDYARKNPDKTNYSTNGVGSSTHILAEMIQRKFGFKASHVPYGGDVPIINALIGRQVQIGLLAIPAAVEFIKAGKIRAIMTASVKRSPILPDTPSIVELGHPDLVSATWFSVVGPAGVPRDIALLLNREVNKALASPEARQVFKGAGLEPTPLELDAFQDYVKSEQDKWGAEISKLDIHVDQ